MRRARGPARRLTGVRGAALLPIATYGLDQLRYLLTYRSHAEHVWEVQGHGYLELMMPLMALLVVVSLGRFATRLVRAWRDTHRDEGPGPSTLALWATCTGVLLVIHVVMEALEMLLIPGNTGFLGLLDIGGLWAIVAAAAVGGLLTLAFRGGRALIGRIARRRRGAPRQSACPPRLERPRGVRVLLAPPLARSAAGRAPPAAGLTAA